MRILWIAIAAAVALLLFGSVYTVGEGQAALRFRFGQVTGPDIKPGLHFKIPIVENVQVFDRRVHNLDMVQEGSDASVDYLVAWRIADTRRYYSATSGSQAGAEQRLIPIVKEAAGNAIDHLSLHDIVALDLDKPVGGMLGKVNAVAGASLGVEVVDVRIRRIDLPVEGDALKSVYDRMRAERAQVAAQLRAEGQEQAAKIQAEADRQKLVITANAERDAQQLRGEGDAQAAAIAAQAYGQDPEFYAFYRSLQSYRTMFGGKDVLVLDPDSELLRYLANPGRATVPPK